MQLFLLLQGARHLGHSAAHTVVAVVIVLMWNSYTEIATTEA